MGINKHKRRMLFYFVQSSIHSLCSEMSPASTFLEVPKLLGLQQQWGSSHWNRSFIFLTLTSFSPLLSKSASCSASIPFFVSHYNLYAAQSPSCSSCASCSSGGHTVWSLAPTHFMTPHIPFLQFFLKQTVPLTSQRSGLSDAYLLHPWASR